LEVEQNAFFDLGAARHIGSTTVVVEDDEDATRPG
jgi:hypothetical protein